MIITTNGPQNVGQIRTHFGHNNLFLSPEEYQREGVWKLEQKRLLIDTIFRGMDIPKFYLWKVDHHTLSDGYPDGETKNLYKEIFELKISENDDPNPYVYEVVDGQQRFRTILEYMDERPSSVKVYSGVWGSPFTALEETPIAKGKLYTELNADQKIKFEESSLTIMVLERATIDEIRDMFLRLQNGTPLNAQEKRNAMGSKMGSIALELTQMPFFTQSVNFDNKYASHHLVASQMLHLEHKGDLMSCASQQLDKVYRLFKEVPMDADIVSNAKKVVMILGKIFPTKNPRLNRSYALSLYWALSRILNVYTITESEYPKIQENFEKLDKARLEAMGRGYKCSADEIYEILSISMSHGTDGKDGISTRHAIISQFVFDGVQMIPRPTLDPRRGYTNEETLLLYGRVGGRCQMRSLGKVCERRIEFGDAVVDHIVPHSKGGQTTLDNGRVAYRACNNARGTRDDFDPETMCHLLGSANVASDRGDDEA